jgi:hypothetical protein
MVFIIETELGEIPHFVFGEHAQEYWNSLAGGILHYNPEKSQA